MTRLPHAPDPELDLVLDRIIDIPPALVWKAWARPEHVKQWFCPAPWSVSSCEIDLRPGGAFNTVMRSPEGEEFPNHGCVLEVVEGKRLVITDTLLASFRPAPEPFFTAIVTIEPHGDGTRYVAVALHRDPEGRAKHEEMGFHDGWGAALDQLVALAKSW